MLLIESGERNTPVMRTMVASDAGADMLTANPVTEKRLERRRTRGVQQMKKSHSVGGCGIEPYRH